MRYLGYALLLMMALAVAGCSGGLFSAHAGKTVSVAGGHYNDLTPAELETLLKKTDPVFVNVHIPYAGEIAGTDLSIPYNELESHLDKLPTDKKAPIVVYCLSSGMSVPVVEELVKRGHSNVYHLAGGMNAWQQAGLPIVGQ